jgi:hypothetical protein
MQGIFCVLTACSDKGRFMTGRGVTRNRIVTFTVLAGVLLCSAVARQTAGEEQQKGPAIGEVVANFQFTDIRYLPRTLSELGDHRAYVLVFTTLDCPIVRRSLPKLRQMHLDYRDQGVQFVAVNEGPQDSVVDVAYQAVRADIEFPFVKDFTGQVAAAVGATRTPQCVVLDAERRLRYRGRIDSEFRLGGVRPSGGRQDLRLAIDDVLKGQDVQVAETPVDGCLITAPRGPRSRELTYYKDVAPLVRKHCEGCHQPGSAAPFSLSGPDDVLAHSQMIAEVVSQRRMPPWYATIEPGHFINDLSLPAAAIATIGDWIHGDQLPGGEADALQPLPERESEWLIGEPDLVIQMPAAASIPATGYVAYQYALLPYVFLEDTWVQKVEINPGNDAVVHHCNMGYAKITDLQRKEFHPEKNFITGYVPGGDPMVLDSGIGFRIPAGSVIGLQLHYVTTGEETTDQTSVGFVFAKEKIQKQIRHFQCHTSRFSIPPQVSHHEVRASRTFGFDATGIGMYCHMHLRGKDMTFTATTPDGKRETLLSVPNYNFEWQSSYRWPDDTVRFSKGTRIDCVAHFDNSSFNPFNPDPTATVRHGQQTYHEMMYGFLFFTRDDEALNLTINPNTGHVVTE